MLLTEPDWFPPAGLFSLLVWRAGTPGDRVQILRDAFKKVLTDRDLLAEAEKRDWGVNPSSGEELAAMAKEIVVQPPEVLEGMKRLLAK